ncbi:G-protein coupled receptor 161 [Patella vulgata]|uniref:G-protein coupled receptor 161 n=1 Tax=Patella vulgata TaxID=6465 RepID=UPI00217F8967|nr:G-protein coupled receptor 161 [Patella vulgata]XP_050409788.1 G-protein coupled receptor 161 [Patella vulgata]XP_050409789.1 G-protein coupled receptor 161 [Patella vulgata]XP_050409790.1 G-protein coupled receptor 161 [Patella vulgata]
MIRVSETTAQVMETVTCNNSAGKILGTAVCKMPEPEVTTTEISLMSVFLGIVILASIVGNILVFVVFIKKRCLLTISNRFVLNLSVCNSFNIVLVMPCVLVSLIAKQWVLGDAWCQITGFIMNVVFGASTLTLLVISIDRYCAVVTPLHYSLLVTSQRCYLMIAGVWMVAIVSSLPPLVGWNRMEFQKNKMICTVKWSSEDTVDRYYTLFLVTVCFVLPLLGMLFAYTVIFRAARTNNERTRRSSIVPSTASDDSVQSPLKNGRRRSSTASILARRVSSSGRLGSLLLRREEWKAAVTSFLIVFTFITSWLPYFIVIVLESLLSKATIQHPAVGITSIILAMASCAVNPFVYVFRSKRLREEIKCILLNRRTKVQLISINRTGSDLTRPPVLVNPEKPLHVSATSTTLTSLASNPSNSSFHS